VMAAQAATATRNARAILAGRPLRRFATRAGRAAGPGGRTQAAGVTRRALFTSIGVTGTSW
jgi:hypothetical protein